MQHLDSSVCIAILRGRSAIRDLPADDQTVISAVVAAELWTGAFKSGQSHPQHSLVAQFIESFPVLDFSSHAAQHYGEIRADLEVKSRIIGPQDLLIAAHARSLGATLITANVGEFKGVKGLKVLAWK